MDNCCCMYTDDCGWYWMNETKRIVTARKMHLCDECATQIPIGATFQLVTGPQIENGKSEIGAWKTCMFCYSVWRDFFDDSCGRIYGALWDYMEECHNISLAEATGGSYDA